MTTMPIFPPGIFDLCFRGRCAVSDFSVASFKTENHLTTLTPMLGMAFLHVWKANGPGTAHLSQYARGWMETGPSHQGLMQSDCCKSIFSLALVGEERGCSYLQQQCLSKH